MNNFPMDASRVSLEDIIGDTPLQVFKQSCQEMHLPQIAQKIPDWPAVAPFLGISPCEIENIRGKWPLSVPAQRQMLLMQWREKNKAQRKDTYENLCKAFVKAGIITLVDTVCSLLRLQDEETQAPTLALSLAPTHADIMTHYVDYVRDIYETLVPDYRARQWPPPLTHKVFNLAMISSKDVIRQSISSEDTELANYMLQGQVNIVMTRRPSVKFEDLFKFRERKREVVLVEGAPGSGKSTLAWDLCLKWMAQELFKSFKLVVYIQLRDPHIQRAKTLVEILPKHSTIQSDEVVTELHRISGKGVLFVLDGWDEYGPGLEEDSLFQELICSPEKLNLNRTTLLITSRPVASRELQKYATSRIEILGFKPEEIHRYFVEVLEGAVESLYAQLEERPVIKASCYLPLNAAIIAHLFKEEHSLPLTLHGVFSAVVCGCIRRHIKRKSGKSEEIPCIEQLPASVQKEFQNLCTLAYHGLSESNFQVTFSDEHLRQAGFSGDLNVLDLMQSAPSFARRDSTLRYFLHLSIQELLTALKISKLPAVEQVDIFKRMFNRGFFAPVFYYYAAITKLTAEGIRDFVGQKARTSVGRDKAPLLNLMRCLYEAQDGSLCCFVAQQLDGALDLSDKTLNPLHSLSVGYFLSQTCLDTDKPFTFTLNKFPLGRNIIHFLAKGLSAKGSACSCVVLNFTYATFEADRNEFDTLFEALKTNTSVAELNLDYCHVAITERNGALFVDMMTNNKTIKKLSLKGNTIGVAGFNFIALGLIRNSGIKELSLQTCDIHFTTDTGPLVVVMLRVNRTLRMLDLGGGNRVDASGLSYIFEGLRLNTGLESVSLQNCSLKIGDHNGLPLVEMMKGNKTLKRLNLSQNSIDEAGLKYVAKGLWLNKALAMVSLRKCELQITKENGPILVEMLVNNSTLQALDVGYNDRINTEGLLTLCEGLRNNGGLNSLNLEAIGHVSNEGWRKFVSCLKDNNHLTKLYIRNVHANYYAQDVLTHEKGKINERREKEKLERLEVICYTEQHQIHQFPGMSTY